MQHLVQGNRQTHNHWHISLKASWKENLHAKLETDANVNVMTDETLRAIGSRHNKSHFIFGRQNTRHVASFFANIETRLMIFVQVGKVFGENGIIIRASDHQDLVARTRKRSCHSLIDTLNSLIMDRRKCYANT